MVIRAGKTRRDQLTHAVGILNDVGATLLGAVLTMMPTRGGGAYSYNYYYYGGNYGDTQPGQAATRSSTGGETKAPEIETSIEAAGSQREASD